MPVRRSPVLTPRISGRPSTHAPAQFKAQAEAEALQRGSAGQAHRSAAPVVATRESRGPNPGRGATTPALKKYPH